jgi:hypothetical protein
VAEVLSYAATQMRGTLFVWIADLLPDQAAGRTADLMERGINTVKQTLERTAWRV